MAPLGWVTEDHLQDCGHIIPLDRPDALFALLAPFLSADLPK